jgi:uncharacterized membrane-anchored protein
MTTTGTKRAAAQMLNKVPEVTIFFWVIKVMATTVGETAADFLNTNLGLGLTGTTLLMGALLAVALVFQFRSRRYIPALYWLAVVFISVAGTLITDNLTDNFGISLWTTTIIFAILMVIAFVSWFAVEKTLSIHTITTTRREAFYWSTILVTFALGTAAGDLISERLDLGYWKSALLFGGLITLVVLARLVFKLNAIAAFWIAYVLTRPLGASIGDYLTAPKDEGGLGIPTNVVSAVFLLTMVGLVIYFTVEQKRADATASTLKEAA